MANTTKATRRARARPRYADAEAVRRKRAEAGLSQAQLAAKTGVTQPHISAIERGASSPSVDVLHALARAFGCKVQDLMPKAGS